MYAEYRFDFNHGFFRWDFYGADNITTELIKNQTQEHYIWATSYDGKVISCGKYQFLQKNVPFRWTGQKTNLTAHIPDLVTAYTINENITAWIDKKDRVRQYSYLNETVVEVLESGPLKAKSAFNLPNCVPELFQSSGNDILGNRLPIGGIRLMPRYSDM